VTPDPVVKGALRAICYQESMGKVLIGTASWTDKSLLKSGWYPKDASSAESRLRFYATQFPLVEVDSTYYFLPSDKNSRLWAERSPEGFTFNVKAFSLLTQHPTKPQALKDFTSTDKKNVYISDLDEGGRDAVWEAFLEGLEPLRAANKLGLLLFQFPQWFPVGKKNRDYIVECAARAAPDRICVEFRNNTWMSERNQEHTLEFLEGHGLPYVCVDMPQGFVSSLPPVAAATADIAVVRFHGRNAEEWESGSVQRRFKYLYSKEELSEWGPRLAELSEQTETTHVLMNNCYSDYAQRNAKELAELLRA
jgi:uncharacterized protein YecE (DUF72 family)